MTKIALSPNPNGTGTLTLAAPDSDNTTTVTLPSATGTLLNEASNLDASKLFGDVASDRITGAVDTLFNVSGSTPKYACRAWVNFDGTGTVSIRESGNVSSITDNGSGRYTVNFDTAMLDANYAVAVTAEDDAGGNIADRNAGVLNGGRSTGAVSVFCGGSSTFDLPGLFVVILR